VFDIDLRLKATEEDRYENHSHMRQAVEAMECNNGQKSAAICRKSRRSQSIALLSKSEILHRAVAKPGIACQLKSRCQYLSGQEAAMQWASIGEGDSRS